MDTVTGESIRAPLAAFMELNSLNARPRIELLTTDSVERVASEVRDSGLTWVWVEGFSGSGKSTFAERLSQLMRWRWIELDALVSESIVDSTRYSEHIDAAKLAAAL